MIQHLAWDSHFLRLPVAKINSNACADELPGLLREAQSRGIRLIYWGPKSHRVTPEFRSLYGANYVVDQVNLRKVVVDAQPSVRLVNEHQVERLVSTTADPKVLELALQAGCYSRFRLDSRFDPDVFSRMYRAWIERSCKGEIADAVYAIRHVDRSIAGIATLATQNLTCSIGLIAVSPEHQRRGLGTMLMQTAEAFATQKRCRELSVVTQIQNTAAIRFYEAAGFLTAESTAWFHFWLDGERCV